MGKPELKEIVKFFSVDFNSIDTNDVTDIRKYLMKRRWNRINVWNYF